MATASTIPATVSPLRVLDHVHVVGPRRLAPQAQAVATYVRRSKPTQESLPEQQEMARRYAARLGFPIVAELTDTLTGLRSDRSGYQELLRLVRSGTVSHVVLFKDDRLGRDDVEFIQTMRELERLGVEVHDTLSGKIEPDMVGLKAWLANREVRTTSNRVLPLMKGKVEKGKAMQRPPLGYKLHPNRDMTGVFIPDEYAPAVQELFRRYVAGESLHTLSEWLSATTGQRKRHGSVRKILSNPFYAGMMVWGRERHSKIDGRYIKDRSEWVHGQHAYPLVDEQTWLAVQARLATRYRGSHERAAGPRYALSGLIWCATDQERMQGKPTNNNTASSYACPVCRHGRSTIKTENALRRLLSGVPIGAEAIAAWGRTNGASSATTSAQKRVRDLEAQVAKLTERRKKLTLRYADDEITRVDYEAAIADTDAELAALEAERDNLGQQQVTDAAVTLTLDVLRRIDQWDELLDTAELADRNEVYRNCVRRVLVDMDENTVTAEWVPAIARLTGHETQTVSL